MSTPKKIMLAVEWFELGGRSYFRFAPADFSQRSLDRNLGGVNPHGEGQWGAWVADYLYDASLPPLGKFPTLDAAKAAVEKRLGVK